MSQLRVKWVYQTAPDTGTASNAQGSISSTPAVDGRYLYFNDMTGYLTKLDRFTGKLIWRKNYVNDLSVPGFVAKSSRNTPNIKGDLIIVGSNMGLVDRLCRLTPGPRRVLWVALREMAPSFLRSRSRPVQSSGERKPTRILHRKSPDQSAGTAT